MGIQPIDLQTLYTQLDKVGKAQVQQTAASQAAREAEMAKNREEAEKRLTTVRETETGGEQTGAVHERNGSSSGNFSGSQQKGSRDPPAQEPEEPPKEIIRDPSLGSIIDISG